ncbi:hypothetical protein ACEQPO_05640 [Bacillus sp. SL00103]
MNSLSLSENGKYLVSASSDTPFNCMIQAHIPTFRTLFGHADDVEAVGAFSKQDTLLVSVSRDRRCLVWDIQAQEPS